MKRLSSWMYTLLAAFFAFAFAPQTFACCEVSDAVARVTVAAPKDVALVHVATFTAKNPAAGWQAWKHQSAEYKKAHPWEGASGVWCSNSTRLSIPCTEEAWKKVPVGTVFLLPADVRVYVPDGVQVPEAIMLAPSANPQLFVLDPTLPVVTKGEQAAKLAAASLAKELADAREALLWVPRLSVISAVALIALLVLLFMYLEQRDVVRNRDETIRGMGARLDETRGPPKTDCGGGCCHAEIPQAPGTPAETRNPPARFDG